jgi:hypothetical protein
MSARSAALDASDIITPDGRIVLTPSRELPSRRLRDDDDVYEEVGTPLNDPMRTTPIRSHLNVPPKGFSEPLILGDRPQSSMRQLHTPSQR